MPYKNRYSHDELKRIGGFIQNSMDEIEDQLAFDEPNLEIIKHRFARLKQRKQEFFVEFQRHDRESLEADAALRFYYSAIMVGNAIKWIGGVAGAVLIFYKLMMYG